MFLFAVIWSRCQNGVLKAENRPLCWTICCIHWSINLWMLSGAYDTEEVMELCPCCEQNCLNLLIQLVHQVNMICSVMKIAKLFWHCPAGFFLWILWCSHTGNHPKEKKFSQIWLQFGVEKIKNLAIFWQPAGICCLNMVISEKQFLKIWWLWYFFFHKNPLY
jgi:hypothetical protein